mmetsp:Transcript_12154/g.48924  ORF Transcript_12154/g.48924 Transcript_12154/m.48924 type:complete len:369 (+) Transcript_12154:62-1168(+)
MLVLARRWGTTAIPAAAQRRAFATEVIVERVAMADPGDVAPLLAWWTAADKPTVRAILGKTEGNGCVNDFSRGYASKAIKDALPRSTHPAVVISGGTEGVLTPHFNVFATREVVDPPTNQSTKRYLSLGVARTRAFLPEEIGTRAQAEATAEAVAEACADAGLAPSEADYVQVKCPLLTSDRVNAQCLTSDTYESMSLSRAASAEGVILATEGDTNGASDEEPPRYSSVAATSAGVELLHSEVVVLGNAAVSGSARSARGIMRDALDLPSVVRCLERDCRLAVKDGQLEEPERILAVLVKADPAAVVRGHRTTMLTDSDINATRHSRAAVGGLLAGLFADTRLFVSGGAEKQGPPGGGPFLIVYRADD